MSEVSPEIIVKTQKALGKYVKKPVLTDKLLRKPPFRFLHDVIKAVVKETGFLEGLFTVAELNSDNVKEKEAKIAFLTKLIEAVKTVSKTDLKVRPSKIVAGLEPTETNILLQTIAKSIDRKVDAKGYIAKLHSEDGSVKSKATKGTKNDKKSSKNNNRKPSHDSSVTRARDSSVTRTPNKSNNVEGPKSTERSKDSSRGSKKDKSKLVGNDGDKVQEAELDLGDTTNEAIIKPKEDESTAIDNQTTNSEISTANNKELDAVDISAANAAEEPSTKAAFSNPRQGSAGLVRPKSARPKSGDRGGTRPPTTASLRPPSVRPSSARPGAPRLRPESALPVSDEPVAMGKIKVIVETFDGGDEEDTVVVQSAPEETDEVEVSGANKGQLVEQILEQIQEGDEAGARSRKVNIDWEQDGLRGKDATTKEVTQLRALIQSLTKTANPLGKLMNYLHEDLEAMHTELQMWTNTKRQLYGEIEKQKKAATEASKPLQDNLQTIRQETLKLEEQILSVRGNILRNEQRISELLSSK